MKLDAIYEHGRLTLPADIRLKRQRIEVRVEFPDDVLAPRSHPEQGAAPKASDIRERIQAILGSDWDRSGGAATSAESSRSIWHRHIEEKGLGRD